MLREVPAEDHLVCLIRCFARVICPDLECANVLAKHVIPELQTPTARLCGHVRRGNQGFLTLAAGITLLDVGEVVWKYIGCSDGQWNRQTNSRTDRC